RLDARKPLLRDERLQDLYHRPHAARCAAEVPDIPARPTLDQQALLSEAHGLQRTGPRQGSPQPLTLWRGQAPEFGGERRPHSGRRHHGPLTPLRPSVEGGSSMGSAAPWVGASWTIIAASSRKKSSGIGAVGCQACVPSGVVGATWYGPSSPGI